MDRIGGPLNKLDEACRHHDIDYFYANTYEKIKAADNELIENVRVDAPLFWPLFFSFFKCKILYESTYGSAYTKTLDFCFIRDLKNRTTGVGYLGDLPAQKLPQEKDYKFFEQEWQLELKKTWVKECEANIPKNDSTYPEGNACDNIKNGIINLANADDTSSVSLPQSNPGTSHQAGTSNINPGTSSIIQEGDNVGSSRVKTDIAQSRPIPQYAGCKLLINEVKSSFVVSDNLAFVEIAKICQAESEDNGLISMTGYVLVTIMPSTSMLQGYTELGGTYMVAPIKEDKKTNYIASVAIIGTATTANVRVPRSVVPPFGNDPIYLGLIYFPNFEVARGVTNRIVQRRGKFLTPSDLDLLASHTQDGLLYGKKCDSACEHTMQVLLRGFNMDTNLLPSQNTITPHCIQGDMSLSRCSDSTRVFEHSNFMMVSPTPGYKNNCPALEIPKLLPFSFWHRGSRGIQSDGQKIFINGVTYCEKFGKPPPFLAASCVQAVATMLGMKRTWGFDIMRKYKRGDPLITPGKTRKRPCAVQDKFEKFEFDIIRRIIIDEFYAKGIAPTFKPVYTSFVSKDVGFKCSKSTFRKVLRGMNFRYKTINRRAVLVQNPTTIARRGFFLKAYVKNAALTEPREYIYIDETWIECTGKIREIINDHFQAYPFLEL